MNTTIKLASSLISRNTLNATSIICRWKTSFLQTELQKQSYGTWALSGFNVSNAARIQPVLDVEKIIANEELYIEAVEKRKMTTKPNPKEVAELFADAKRLNEQRADVELRKNENVSKVQEAMKTLKVKQASSDEVKDLRQKGRELREEYRLTTNKFNTVNDKLVSLVLSLPNLLDPITPEIDYEVLREMGPPEGVAQWKFPTEPFWRLARPGSVGPQEQFAYGGPAWLELDLAANCQMNLLNEGFVETGNVDFVRRILLEGACLDPNQFLRIRENTVKTGMAHATYLVGGASFPAFLALFAQSVIYGHDSFPIKYFVIGRTYAKPIQGVVSRRTIQSSSVQVFLACKTEEQQEEEFLKLASFMEKFYSHTIGISFQTQLLSASQLRTYEKKKISFVLSDRQKTIGDLSTVGDYVSKRLLCCYANEHRVPQFLHMVTGQFFDLSGFLQPDLPVPALSKKSQVPTCTEVTVDKSKPGWKVLPSGSDSVPDPTNKQTSSTETTLPEGEKK